jgi:hypothetical protein
MSIVVVDNHKNLTLSVAILDDIVRSIEHVTTDDTELAGGDVLEDLSDHHRLHSLSDVIVESTNNIL